MAEKTEVLYKDAQRSFELNTGKSGRAGGISSSLTRWTLHADNTLSCSLFEDIKIVGRLNGRATQANIDKLHEASKKVAKLWVESALAKIASEEPKS